MPGNKNSGRKSVPVEIKKARGTFRKDRHGKQAETEQYLANSNITIDQIVPPPAIKDDKYTMEAYLQHAQWLCKYNQFYGIDKAEFDQLFITLSQLREVTEKRIELENKGLMDNLDRYKVLTYLEMKLRKQFIEMGKDFLMTPVIRSKLTVEQLTADKMAYEKQEREANLIENLFSGGE